MSSIREFEYKLKVHNYASIVGIVVISLVFGAILKIPAIWLSLIFGIMGGVIGTYIQSWGDIPFFRTWHHRYVFFHLLPSYVFVVFFAPGMLLTCLWLQHALFGL